MAPSMRIVVSGGAGFWLGPDGRCLDEYVLNLTGKREPRVCYLPTASGDDDTYISGFYVGLGGRCKASHLTLFRPSAAPPRTPDGNRGA